jgi:hypothetical protein
MESLLRRSVRGSDRCRAIFSQRCSEAAKAQRMKFFFSFHESLPSTMQPFACHPEEGSMN